MAEQSHLRDHQAWIGYLQPDGLVVSPAALVDSQIILSRNVAPLQQNFCGFVEERENGPDRTVQIADVKQFLTGFLEWPNDCLVGEGCAEPIPDSLRLPLSTFGELLAPTLAFKDVRRPAGEGPWVLLVQAFPAGTDLDAPFDSKLAGWTASHARRFERLLREVQVPIGLLTNHTHVRLIYAPPGENTGAMTFPVEAMTEVAGRPILEAFHALLGRYRLLAAPSEARLPAILKRSRDYQARVSTALAGQVLEALYELLRGFQAADDRRRGELLKRPLAEDPDSIYGGLLTVLMRLVFLLYAEDRGMMPGSELYVRNYSLHGLFERLRTDAEHHPDTMDHRYGAWAQLIALFRSVFHGCRHPWLAMPARAGHLFDPDRFPFLEGRTDPGGNLPLVSDGVLFRVLSKLLILDGDRLSYRTLDVEQIGSVYEMMMGFHLRTAAGTTIALKPQKNMGAPTPIDLEELLAVPGKDRAKWIADRTDLKISATSAAGGTAQRARGRRKGAALPGVAEVRPPVTLESATSVDDLLVVLERKIAREATPQPLPKGAMVLIPSDERRKSGSHYTPRSLTEPIVRKALEPVLRGLGDRPTPEQILELNVCDPAMGSGAFLVEACRQLGDALVKAWADHGYKPQIPPDEDELLFARRLVAQRCLYGVDRNPMAVDLAKLSLWLATLAKDHPFTFLDHSLRCGDALVGLTLAQILNGHWEEAAVQLLPGQASIKEAISAAVRLREEIGRAGDDLPPDRKAERLAEVERGLELARIVGNAVIAAFFAGTNDRERRRRRDEYVGMLGSPGGGLLTYPESLRPFHWEIEFPEVFRGERPGFDAMIGNPPFAGKNTLINGNPAGYLDWLKTLHEESHGNADLVAHFFRRAFTLVRENGCFGLIATNTIGQGDPRSTGLRWICTHGGTIYAARKRYKWPGAAAVVVSIVWVAKAAKDRPAPVTPPFDLDGRPVDQITAFLFHTGGHENPEILHANADKSYIGSYVLGMGFTFDDTDKKGVANPIARMEELIAANPRNAERIFPYIGGEEVNDSPTHAHHRYVINFADFPLRRDALGGETWAGADPARRGRWLRTGIVPLDYPGPVAADWPDLIRIVEERVKPERTRRKSNGEFVLSPLYQRNGGIMLAKPPPCM